MPRLSHVIIVILATFLIFLLVSLLSPFDLLAFILAHAPFAGFYNNQITLCGSTFSLESRPNYGDPRLRDLDYRGSEDLFVFRPEDSESEISHERDLKNDHLLNEDQVEVLEAMKHSWFAYKKYAWGADHLRPVSRGIHTWFNVGLTLIDSLDSLILMGMEDEVDEATKWIDTRLTFEINRDVNCFEMTIRVLGGLLSAFHLTRKPVFLYRAVDVGERLIHCFDSPSQMVPFSDVNLKTRIPKSPEWTPDSSLSEVSTMQLEFRDLSQLTHDSKYEEISFKTTEYLRQLVENRRDPLLPMYINPNNGCLTHSTITLGARADSYYEYLLKQYLQTGIPWLLDAYLDAIDAIISRLVRVTRGPQKFVFVAEILPKSGNLYAKMDHLVCFLPGALALGYYHYNRSKSDNETEESEKWSDRFSNHLWLAEDLARTCYSMHNMTGTGLSPEIVHFGVANGEAEMYIKAADSHNLLRPEYIESLFYLYHITGNKMYRDQGRKVRLVDL